MSLARLAGAMILTPPSSTVSPALVSSQLPPLSPARSTITEPGFMLRTPSAVIRIGAGAAGDLGGGDDHVLPAGVLGERLADLLVLLVGERAGVAALVLGVGDEVELERAAAERGDLLPGGAADVEAGDDGAEALGGGDRLQAGDAGAEHQHARRRDGAGGRGHHREEAAGLAGGEQRRGVAGDVGLGGERVHRLGAGDPRDRLDGEAA